MLHVYNATRFKYMSLDPIRMHSMYIQLDHVQKQHLVQQNLLDSHGMPKPNMIILGMYIDKVLMGEMREFNLFRKRKGKEKKEDGMQENVDSLMLNLFTDETNVEVRLLLLQKLHQLYLEMEGSRNASTIELCLYQVFKTHFETEKQCDQIQERESIYNPQAPAHQLPRQDEERRQMLMTMKLLENAIRHEERVKVKIIDLLALFAHKTTDL